LAATAGPLVLTVMGPKWAGAVPLVQLLAFAMPFTTLHVLLPPATNALGRPGIAAISSAAGAVLLPTAFLLGVRHGPIGMAAAWVVAMPLITLLSTSLSLPVIGLSWRRLGASVLPPLAAAVAMGLTVAAIDRALPPLAPPLRLAILVPTGVLTYGVLAWLLARPLIGQALALARRRGDG
jgi:O-antigen/teichoic acid export membrane protein